MNFVIGGAWQGKTEAACNYFNMENSQIVDGRTCLMEAVYSAKGIHHFHEYIRRMLETGIDTNVFCEELYQKNPDILIISNEIGYGLVPLDAFERQWREQTGRICCEVAQKAERVLRVTAGIPLLIKGTSI